MSVMWSSVYDRTGPFATVMADVSLANDAGPRVLRTLAQSIGQDLDELGAAPAAVEHVRSRMAEPVSDRGPVSRFVVATVDGVVIDEVLPVASLLPLVEWEPLPDPGPLLTHEPFSPFVLVALDDEGADVEELALGSGAEAGPSHLRRTASRRVSAPEVVDHLMARTAEGLGLVLVAGRAHERARLVEALDDVPATVVDVGDPESPQQLRRGVEQATREAARRQVETVAEEISHRRDRGATVLVGPEETLRALAEGRLDVVVIDREKTGRQHVEVADHPDLDLGSLSRGRVRADLALLAGASRGGAAVVVVEADDLAFLRALATEEPSDVAVICLHRDGAAAPTWFESTARALAERRPVTVLRHPRGVVGFSDCRGEWQDVFSTDLSAAVRGLVEGAMEMRSPGYRELVVEDVARPL